MNLPRRQFFYLAAGAFATPAIARPVRFGGATTAVNAETGERLWAQKMGGALAGGVSSTLAGRPTSQWRDSLLSSVVAII